MQPLYQARDRIEAQLLWDVLDRHLIGAVILGDYLSGAAGELPVDIYPTVWVIDDAGLKRARELLAEFQTQSVLRAALDPWICPGCGESVDGDFDLCWNCNRSRPA